MSDYSKIFIRYGHDTIKDGSFTGASGVMKEKDVIDAYGPAIKDQLESLGYDVKSYRSKAKTYKDSTEALKAGIKAAKDWGADIFISCHANSVEDSSANGTEVLYNDAELADDLAKNVCSTISKKLETKSRGTQNKNDKFGELRDNDIPAIIIEPIFVSNKSDCKKFTDYGGSDLGKDIADTIDKCIKK